MRNLNKTTNYNPKHTLPALIKTLHYDQLNYCNPHSLLIEVLHLYIVQEHDTHRISNIADILCSLTPLPSSDPIHLPNKHNTTSMHCVGHGLLIDVCC